MVGCSVLGCKSRTEHQDKSISFHAFPRDNMRRCKEWIKFTGRKDWTPTTNTRICSIHFKINCFYQTKSLKCLRKHSMPTLKPCKPLRDDDDDEGSSTDSVDSDHLRLLRLSSSSGSWKRLICRCCLKEKGKYDITEPYRPHPGDIKIFMVDLLNECGIKLSHLNHPEHRLICESCVISLKHAHNFKQQVWRAEQTFMQCFDNATKNNQTNANKTLIVTSGKSTRLVVSPIKTYRDRLKNKPKIIGVSKINRNITHVNSKNMKMNAKQNMKINAKQNMSESSHSNVNLKPKKLVANIRKNVKILTNDASIQNVEIITDDFITNDDVKEEIIIKEENDEILQSIEDQIQQHVIFIEREEIIKDEELNIDIKDEFENHRGRFIDCSELISQLSNRKNTLLSDSE